MSGMVDVKRAPDFDCVRLDPDLKSRFVNTVRARLPQKSFGYFISARGSTDPQDFIIFEENIRNASHWKPTFESYGQYFLDHDDAGFVASPQESWRVQKEIWSRGMEEVGVFHSHLRHPGNFSCVDYDLHVQRFEGLWHMIISMRNPDLPQLRAFSVSRSSVKELRVSDVGDEDTLARTARTPSWNSVRSISESQEILRLNPDGRPRCKDTEAVFFALATVLHTGRNDAIEELIVSGFLRDSETRYEEHIKPLMRRIDGGAGEIGTSEIGSRHFCGESPRHAVWLSPFSISQMLVTNELLGRFDPDRFEGPAANAQNPAVGLTWYDAAVFALWMGCRLPTEAEWEFACGGEPDAEWCCEESRLSRYAWYSQNSQGEVHPVATKEPNVRGLFDMHGNVWEWCGDVYDEAYYLRAPLRNPARVGSGQEHRVCRGGSMHSLAEMCRTRYRFHEPPEYRAFDLGFRLARNELERMTQGDHYDYLHDSLALSHFGA